MAEKRLIYANALFQEADKALFMGFHAEERKKNFLDLISAMLDNCPTVDAVEVVRCKDCIRYNTDGCANGFGWCEAYNNGRMDNDFCSFGAKMDGDGNG